MSRPHVTNSESEVHSCPQNNFIGTFFPIEIVFLQIIRTSQFDIKALFLIIHNSGQKKRTIAKRATNSYFVNESNHTIVTSRDISCSEKNTLINVPLIIDQGYYEHRTNRHSSAFLLKFDSTDLCLSTIFRSFSWV